MTPSKGKSTALASASWQQWSHRIMLPFVFPKAWRWIERIIKLRIRVMTTEVSQEGRERHEAAQRARTDFDHEHQGAASTEARFTN